MGLLGAVPALSLGQAAPAPYVFRHLAGAPGGGGWKDGIGAAARFNNVTGVASDLAGNVYVTDSGNNTIRRITPDGTVTTIAGSPPLAGFADGTGSAARFSFPTGPSVDMAGNLYVADEYNDLVRMVTPSGVVTTYAGTPGDQYFNNGNADGVGAAAQFRGPSGTTVDTLGNVFVADAGNEVVRKIAPGAIVTTLPITGPSQWPSGALWDNNNGLFGASPYFPNADQLEYHSQIAVDHSGNLYFGNYQWVPGSESDAFPQGSFLLILKLDRSGVVTTLTQFPLIKSLIGVAVDPSDRLVIGTQDGILRLEQNGTVTTVVAGPSIDGSGLTVTATGDCLIADDEQILKVSPQGVLSTLAGLSALPGSADGVGPAAGFSSPKGVAVDASGNVFVADTNNDTIRRIAPDGTVTTLAGAPGVAGGDDGNGSAARFDHPGGIVIDGAGNLFVAESLYGRRIRKITPTGVVTTLSGISPAPYQDTLAVDPSGNLFYIGLNGGEPVLYRVAPAGAISSVSNLRIAGSMAVDHAGNLYVVDYDPSTLDYIKIIAPDGTITRLTEQELTFTDTAASWIRLGYGITGMAIDAAGNLLVTEADQDTVYRITPQGAVTTLGGLRLYAGSDDGLGTDAQFDGPTAIAVDNTGKIYVADTGNNAIRVGEIAGPPVITTQPASQTVAAGGTARLTVAVSSALPVTYQWTFKGSPIAGATADTLTLASATAERDGDYAVVVTNQAGSVTSTSATLTVSAAGTGTSGGPGGSGPSNSSAGGGALSGWFALALVALGACRLAIATIGSGGKVPARRAGIRQLSGGTRGPQRVF